MTLLTTALIDWLNKRADDIIKKDGPSFIKGRLPEDIVDRVSRERRYSCGFTGFKPSSAWAHRQAQRNETADDAIQQSAGLVGQFLAAVAPDQQSALAAGKRGDGWKFYYADVPGPMASEYRTGELFEMPSEFVRQQVIDWTDDELTAQLRDGVQRLCDVIIKGEAGR